MPAEVLVENRRLPARTQVTDRPVDVLLVSTASKKHGAAIGESLGSEALAGHLLGERRGRVTVDHVDMQLDPAVTALRDRIATQRPDVVGISVKIGAHDQAGEIMDGIRGTEFPDGRTPLVVMGGVVPTFATTEMLRRHPDVIMSVREGENAAVGVVDHVRGERELRDVPGIWYVNEEGKLVMTKPQRLDLSKRHLPARITTQRLHEELGGMSWAEASRGCDSHCTFCSIRSLHGGGFDGDIAPSSVVADFRRLREMGINGVSLTDDDFGGDYERTAVLAGELIQAGLGIDYSASTRADNVWQERGIGEKLSPQALAERNTRKRKIMEELYASGLKRVFMGMESGSPTQLKRYGKQITVEGNHRALEVLNEIGIDVVAGYIPIDPAMSLPELGENLEFLRRTGMWKKITNPLSVLRVQEGSPYKKYAEQKGLLGPQTEDLVFYEAKFEDPRVQRVAQLADQWVDDMYPIIFGLKGEVATQTLTLGPGGEKTREAQIVEEALFRYKGLEMSFIESIVAALEKDKNANLDEIVAGFVGRREVLTQGITGLVEQGIIGKNRLLQEAIFERT